MTCTFFGHSDCYELNSAIVFSAIENLIKTGVNTFYVGQQGNFDSMVFNCLIQLREKYRHILFYSVLAYIPKSKDAFTPSAEHSVYPEELETCPPRFAIDKRNRWMIGKSDFCLCYVNDTWGGAYKFATLAKKKGLTVINLGKLDL